MARPRRSKPTAPVLEPGSCFVVPLPDGRYTACQFIASSGPDASDIIALDWLGDGPPTLEELASAPLLVVSHHSWTPTPQRWTVPGPPPPEYALLGVVPPRATFTEPCRSFGAWRLVCNHVVAQRWWDRDAPQQEIAAYLECKAHARDPLALQLGDATLETARGVMEVAIGPNQALSVPVDAPVNWMALDPLGCLYTLHYEGQDATVVDYVRGRALIGELVWSAHGQTHIDLSHTQVRGFVVEVPAHELVVDLPASLKTLQLVGYRGQPFRVRHPRAGQGLELALYDLRDGAPPVPGLEQLSQLSLIKPRVVDLAALGYPSLRGLSVHMDSGRVDHLGALAAWSQLGRLDLFDAYTMDPEQMPRAAELAEGLHLSVHGLRKHDAAILKRRLAGLAQLELRGAKTDAWLAANAHNPFRDWVDESPALGKAACKIYKQAVTQLAALGAGDTDTLHAHLLDFVRAFNRIDAKHGLDTLHREQIYEAFHQLAEGCAVETPATTLDAWFDEERDF